MTISIPGLGEARRRQEAARRRGERYQVDDETRAIRAALLAAREAVSAGQQAEVEAEKQARPDATRTILAHASLDELNEFQRVAGQLDGRRLADLVGDVIRQRRSNSYIAPIVSDEPVVDIETAAEEEPAEAVSKAGASTGRRTRRTAS